jgi:hypothetical protein
MFIKVNKKYNLMACANHYSRCHVAIGNASLSLVATIELQAVVPHGQTAIYDSSYLQF